MEIVEKLHLRYAPLLNAEELRFETEPAAVWRFRSQTRPPLTIEIEDLGQDLYSVIIDEPALDFEIHDALGTAIAEFLEAIVSGRLVKVSWQLYFWRGWWLENGAGSAVSVEPRARDTRFSRFIESLPGYRESRVVLADSTRSPGL